MPKECILCNKGLTSFKEVEDLVYGCSCSNCGEYEISSEALDDLPQEFKGKFVGTKHLISGYTLEWNTDNQAKLRIFNKNIDDIVAVVIKKSTLQYKLDRLLYYIYSRTNYFGKDIQIDKTETAICYALNSDEVQNLCKALRDMGYINVEFYGQDFAKCTLTTRGYAYIDGKTKVNSQSMQCFVAMWFNEEMIEQISPYITKAIVDTGFKAFISVKEEHNDDVCDAIVAGIKNSRFMIADFTGQRPSVYFEAGMASGHGIPVVWTCREDWFDNQAIVEKEALVDGEKKVVSINDEGHVHFDVNHYKFIVWRDGEDLHRKLVNRIEATIK